MRIGRILNYFHEGQGFSLPVWFVQGGAVLWLLGVLSIVSLAAIIVVGVAHFRANLSDDGAREETLLGKLLNGFNTDMNNGVAREAAVMRIVSNASLAFNKMRNGMRVLELIAATAPLLGLLGTVLGMIEAFQQLEEAGSQVDPSLLSGGIWKALLTTAAGLVVAMPALAAWHVFDRRLESARVTANAMISRLASGAES